MTPEQVRLLQWLSKAFELLGNPELRKCINGVQMEAICIFAQTNISAALLLDDTEYVTQPGAALDIAELEKLFIL